MSCASSFSKTTTTTWSGRGNPLSTGSPVVGAAGVATGGLESPAASDARSRPPAVQPATRASPSAAMPSRQVLRPVVRIGPVSGAGRIRRAGGTRETGLAECAARPLGGPGQRGCPRLRSVIGSEEPDREELGRAAGAYGEVVLRRRTAADGDHLELVVDGVFAMDDVDTSTERALATEALRRCRGSGLRVLHGGLGLGWTAATVRAEPRVAEVHVAELQPALVGWAADGLLPGLPTLLAERLHLQVADVGAHLAGSPQHWDAVLLDVDNGPAFLVHQSNAEL